LIRIITIAVILAAAASVALAQTGKPMLPYSQQSGPMLPGLGGPMIPGNVGSSTPPQAGFLLLANGTSFLLLANGTSQLCLAGGC
jgi:hypothetical protein